MTLPIFWLPEAVAELKQAYVWYNDKRPELGERFARAAETAVDSIAQNPLQFPVVYRGRRRAGVWRFPYGIFFEIQDHQILVIACFHAKRSPSEWQSR